MYFLCKILWLYVGLLDKEMETFFFLFYVKSKDAVYFIILFKAT